MSLWDKLRAKFTLPADYELQTPDLPHFDPNAPIIRQECFFSGRVQGVGFRFQTAELAQQLGLTGWVKNLDDGRVQAVFQGPSDKIAFIKKALAQRPYIKITHITSRKLTFVSDEHVFEPRY